MKKKKNSKSFQVKTNYVQRKWDKAGCRFLGRNNANWKTVEQKLWSAEIEKKSVNVEFFTQQKWGYVRHTKAERIHHNQICTIINDRGNYSRRRKIIGVGNLDLNKGKKSTSKT